ncbi:MAG: methionyl-tRNA formyltransferase [bacterium]
MKTVFFGTPDIAVPFLRCLASSHEVAFVVTRPDRPAGRGLFLSSCAVKREALALGLEVLQPPDPCEIAPQIRAADADVCVVVAYGKILRKDVLEIPRFGFLNMHFSLLPRYRGAAPVPWAIINGENETGVTAFWLDEGLDTGPVALQKTEKILPVDDAVSLLERLGRLGVEVLREALEEAASGRAVRRPQEGEACKAPCLSVSDSWLDFNQSVGRVHDKVRGLACGPRARVICKTGGKETEVQVLRTSLPERTEPSVSKAHVPPDAFSGRGDSTALLPGTIVRVEREKGFFVQCLFGFLLVEEVQPEGKKRLKAWDFLNGFRLKPGDMFSVRKQSMR